MKKIFLLFLILLSFALFQPALTYAATQTGDCQWTIKDELGNVGPPLFKDVVLGSSKLFYEVEVPLPNHNYNIEVGCGGLPPCGFEFNHSKQSNQHGKIEDSYSFNYFRTDSDITLNLNDPNSSINPICTYNLQPPDWIIPTPTPNRSSGCSIKIEPPTYIYNTTQLTVKGEITNLFGFDTSSAHIYDQIPNDYGIINYPNAITISGNGKNTSFIPSNTSITFESKIGYWPNGKYDVSASVYVVDASGFGSYSRCQTYYNVCNYGCNAQPAPTPTPTNAPGCEKAPCTIVQDRVEEYNCADSFCKNNCNFCISPVPATSKPPPKPVPSLAPICDQLPTDFQGKCWDCQKLGKLWTAIGCIPTDFELILKDYVFVYGIGIAGGIAFLYFLFGVFLIITSAGVAEKIAEGKEIIISALSGLLLIIFSIFLLRVIGVDILKLPDFH